MRIMKATSGAGFIGMILIAALLMSGNMSCSKKKQVLGNFYVKGRFLNTSGTPKANMEVYVEVTDNASNVGGSTTRERAGSSTTDSLGYFFITVTLYGSGDYKIEPPGYFLAPGLNDTLDLGTKKW